MTPEEREEANRNHIHQERSQTPEATEAQRRLNRERQRQRRARENAGEGDSGSNLYLGAMDTYRMQPLLSPEVPRRNSKNCCHNGKVINNNDIEPAPSFDDLNEEQHCLMEAVLQSVESAEGGNDPGSSCFYVDAPGGSGKTHVFNKLAILATLQQNDCWTGIAATLMTEGSLFKLPVPVVESSSCNVSPNSKQADIAKKTSSVHHRRSFNDSIIRSPCD